MLFRTAIGFPEQGFPGTVGRNGGDPAAFTTLLFFFGKQLKRFAAKHAMTFYQTNARTGKQYDKSHKNGKIPVECFFIHNTKVQNRMNQCNFLLVRFSSNRIIPAKVRLPAFLNLT